MALASTLQKGLDNLMLRAGKQIIIRYYSGAVDTVYDDELTLEISGNTVFTSGIVMPLNNQRGSEDANLLEQGKIQDGDKKLFISGNLLLTGSANIPKIFLGSQTLLGSVASYSVVPLGVIAPEAQDIPVYKKAYIRLLPTGSFIGEI